MAPLIRDGLSVSESMYVKVRNDDLVEKKVPEEAQKCTVGRSLQKITC